MPNLADSFDSLALSPALIRTVRELGYEKLTPIQAQSIPALLAGKDLIGQSKTGSGKTAAFSLPILQKIDLHFRDVQAVVLCPTRELCTQVAREIRKLARHHPGLQVLILSGGQPIFPQLTALEKGAHVVVGTPGRLLDHLNRRTLDLGRVSTLVLDEADRMLDMGFQDDMEKILKEIPSTRQTVFFSATFPKSIETLSRSYQRDPVRVSIDDPEEAHADIEETYYELDAADKARALLSLLRQNPSESAIVFCNLKVTVADLDKQLSKAGVSVGCIHGDLEQSERDRVMAKFRNLSTRVLVATDVAARGIDVASLDSVYNFDLPQPDVYVHRIGRTGRAGRKGIAITLLTPQQKWRVSEIEKFTGSKIGKKEITLSKPMHHRDGDATTSKEAPMKTEAVSVPSAELGAKMATLYISGGRKDKVRPGDILGALTGDAGRIPGSEIGKIEIHDRFSYVAVSKGIAPMVLERLQNGRIKGRKFRVEMVR